MSQTYESSTFVKNQNDGSDSPVVIVGGGISGLSAAWTLQKAGVPYVVLEQTNRWGGKIRTEFVDGYGDQPFVVEAGPDSVISQKPWAIQLAREIGLEDQIIGTNDVQRKTFVLNNGKMTPLPDGVLMIIPTRFMPFALSPLISPFGKLRMALEPFLPPKMDDDDESLADFVRRRLGNEALDKLAEPLMSGIYNTDAEDQSLMATFPRFRAMEQKYGSLTRGMLAGIAARKSAPVSNKPKLSLFTSFKNGMETLITTLVDQLTGDLRLDTGVTALEALDGGYRLTLSDGSKLDAAQVILTTPTNITANLLRDLSPEAASLIENVTYVGTGTVSLAYRTHELEHDLNGFGVVIPRSANRAINAITWTSTKFNHRVPEGYALIRVFFGGARSPQSMAFTDDTLLQTVRDELKSIMGVMADPVFTRIYRWKEATPQYFVGHLDRMDQIEAAIPDGIQLTGSAYRGIGVPDCVHEAQLTAERIIASVR